MPSPVPLITRVIGGENVDAEFDAYEPWNGSCVSVSAGCCVPWRLAAAGEVGESGADVGSRRWSFRKQSPADSQRRDVLDIAGTAITLSSHPRGRTVSCVFKVPGVIPDWGVTADGARFLFAVPVSQPPPFNFVRDWQARLPRQESNEPERCSSRNSPSA